MNTLKKILVFALAVCMVIGLAACGGTKTAQPQPVEAPKPVILVVSFGTSYNDNRELSIGGIESAIANAFPDYEVRRAFTADTIINILKDRDNIVIDNVKEAMERLVADGVKEVIIQPTHVMAGYEYDDIVKEVNKYADKFDTFKIGKNLLESDADYEQLVKVLAEETKEYIADNAAVAFMGHGTEHTSNATYEKLQAAFNAAGYGNYFIGTVEAEPTVDDVIEGLSAGGYGKVTLLPLMIVAGDHANNDMAGDEEDSWKSVISAAGFDVECVIKGMGQYAGVQQMIVDHCAATIAE